MGNLHNIKDFVETSIISQPNSGHEIWLNQKDFLTLLHTQTILNQEFSTKL